MIKSMTGYGKAECEIAGKKIIIELRSLNSKQLDLNIKLSSVYREKEPVTRTDIASRLKRGKIDLVIYADYKGADSIPTINVEVVKNYVEQLKKTGGEIGLDEYNPLEMMKIAMRLPDTYVSEKPDLDEAEWEAVYKAFLSALEQLDNYRIQEGEAMRADLDNRINSIEKHLAGIGQFEEKRIESIRKRIRQNLQEYLNSSIIDRDRFEQEIIYYLEKIDISEEKVRLENHIAYFRETLREEEQTGKKLGFISQEIGREINTIGSKANDFNIQKLVVKMKDDLEKIKEQSLNIL